MKSQMLRRASSVMTNVTVRAGRIALNMVMPPHCPVSNDEIKASGALGSAGWAALHFIEEPFCRRCGVPYAADYGDEVECPSCIANPPAYERARAAVVYDDASHRLVVGFKHSDRTEMAPMFAKWMARAGKEFLGAETILAPVPLHRRRLAVRRYNQSALLAGALAKETGVRVIHDGFVRARATPPQKDLSADARQRNVSGAFRADKQKFKSKHVVLIDDVLTTGATLSSAARELKRAGAARVDALVLARVVKGGIGAI